VSSPSARTYFEDTGVGQASETPAMTLTQAHVALYEGLAAEPQKGEGVVPDLLPLCLVTGLGWRVPRPPLAVLAFLSIEWEIARPLRVGETIRAATRTVARRTLREGGVVVEDYRVVDQRGEVAQRGRFTFLVARKPE
jgi:acyl dehydratase